MALYFRNGHVSQVTVTSGSGHCHFEPSMFDLDNKQRNFRQRTGSRDRSGL